jgi:hypothetical protein
MMESELNSNTSQNDEEEDEVEDSRNCPQFFQIQLGSKKKAITIDFVEINKTGNPDFNHFYEKISDFVDGALGVAIYHSTKVGIWLLKLYVTDTFIRSHNGNF